MVAHAGLIQLGHQPVAGAQHLGHVGIHVGLVGQGSQGGRHRQAVDVIGAGNAADAIDHGRSADGKTDAQARQPRRFGQGAQHHQVGVGRKGIAATQKPRQHAVAGEGLIELIHHHQGLGRRRRQGQDRVRGQAGARGVIGIADQQQLGRRHPGPQQGGGERLQREGEIRQ